MPSMHCSTLISETRLYPRTPAICPPSKRATNLIVGSFKIARLPSLPRPKEARWGEGQWTVGLGPTRGSPTPMVMAAGTV